MTAAGFLACSAATARWMASVVLPAPPFWEMIAIVFMSNCYGVYMWNV